MLEIFKTVNGEITRLERFEEGVWVNLTNPTEDEINSVCEGLNVESEYIVAALDEEERSRIEYDNGQTLIIVDIPMPDTESDTIYTTLPLGIILAKDSIITVCLRESVIIREFINKKIKAFYTFYRTRFILQILYRNASQYLHYLKIIEKTSSRIEQDLHKSMKNKELIQLLKLEKSLVYFSTSLKANEIVLEKMLKLEYIKKYPDDTELLEDVIIENKQAIEMATIYSSITSGTMDAFASLISNNLNIVMKFLTSITIVMAIPTMVASLYGMNVKMLPFADSPYAFWIVLAISATLSALSAFILARRKMF
jgi:magnesium transporter